MDPSNYRPISLLALISKILEKIAHEEMIDYLTQHNVLYKYHSGFRTKHSTDLCLLYLSGKISKSFDNGFFTGMILIDLQKAFDTIDHNILLEKLKAAGFCKPFLTLASYFQHCFCILFINFGEIKLTYLLISR